MSYELTERGMGETIKNKSALFLMGLIVLTFAYIITKDNPGPRFLLFAMVFASGMIYLLSGLFRREVVTYFLIVYLPFSKQIPGTLGHLIPGLNLTNMLIILTAAFWFFGKREKEEGSIWTRTPLDLPISLFLLVGVISICRGLGYGNSYLGEATLQYYRRWVIPIFLYFQVFNTIRTREEIKNILILIMMVTTIVALMAIYDYLESDKRVGGIVDQPNFLAAFFNYYMFLFFAFFLLNFKRFKYWLLLVPFLICLRGIMVTFSRAGYLAFAVGLYAIACFRSKFSIILLAIATFLVLLHPAFLPEGIRYRMAQTFQHHQSNPEVVQVSGESLDESASDRLKVWEGAIVMIKEHPFFGIGFYLFESKILHYWSGRKPHDAHNTYLSIAAEMGIPALIIFLWIIWRIFWNTQKFYRKTHDVFAKGLALGLLGGIFGLLVSNIYGCRLNYPEVSGYFWILTALVMRLRILERTFTLE